METFAITCTTCRSRLLVRDQTAIGQILACPKCGGMVMVKPPPAFSEQSEQRSDLPTATEVEGPAVKFNQTLHSSAFDVLEDLLSDAPPKVPSAPGAGATKSPPAASSMAQSPPPPQAPKPRFVGGPPIHRSTTPPVHRSATPPSALPPKAPTATTSASPTTADSRNAKPSTPERPARANGGRSVFRDSEPLPPPPPSEAEAGAAPRPAEAPVAAPRQNHWFMVAGSVALGIGLAVAAVGLAIFYRPTTEPAAKPDVAREQAVPDAGVSTTDTPQPAAAPQSPDRAIVVEPPAAVTDVAKQATEAPAASEVAKAPEATASRDPLGLVNDSSPAPAAAVASTESLAKLDNLIGGANNDPLAKSTPPETLTPSLPMPDSSPAKPQAPRPPARDVDVAKRLADPLPAIETAETPLADFVQLLSDLSTIPITLDVPFAPATAQSKVALQLANTTVGAALAEGLKPLRLEYVVVDDQLIIRRMEPSSATPFSLDVKDLTGGDEQQASELAELLKATLEPGQWDGAVGGGSIAVDGAKKALVVVHRRALQFAVLIAVEKLRRARTPPLAHVSKLDPALFTIETRLAQAKPRLERPISLNYRQPTRLLTILDRLGGAAGIQILVDWHDVAIAGWNPAAEATLVASNQPLEQALDALLGPLDLTWRIIDGQTLQVVTPARLAEQGEFELYKIGELITKDLSGDALAAKVRAALGDAVFRDGGGSSEIRFDSESNSLLAWLPQPKQRELEALLVKWKAESGR